MADLQNNQNNLHAIDFGLVKCLKMMQSIQDGVTNEIRTEAPDSAKKIDRIVLDLGDAINEISLFLKDIEDIENGSYPHND